MPQLNLVPATFEDYRRLAEKRLPRTLFDYVDGGAYREQTLRENVEDFSRIKIAQRVMRDVSSVSTTTRLLDEDVAMPLALAPVGMAGMMARRGEVQAKRAADALGIPYCLSTVGICSLEEVAEVSDKPFWFQLYMLRDRAVVEEILQRAAAVGVRTLVFTVDLAVVGARYRDVRNGLAGGTNLWGRLRSGLLDYMLHPRWALDVGLSGGPHTFGNLTQYVPKASNPADFREWVGGQFDASVTWKDIEWLRGIWNGKLVIKGVLSAEDAQSAADVGADAVIVSNHGGRQLDDVSSAVAMLPQVADAVGDRVEVLVDGGVRNGLDVAKACALGAHAALIGRPWVYAAAARGEAGVRHLLGTFQEDLRVALGLAGVNAPAELDRQMVS